MNPICVFVLWKFFASFSGFLSEIIVLYKFFYTAIESEIQIQLFMEGSRDE